MDVSKRSSTEKREVDNCLRSIPNVAVVSDNSKLS